MYEKNESFVKNSLDPMFRTNNSSKNFTSVRIINVFNEKNSDTRIFAFAKNADVKFILADWGYGNLEISTESAKDINEFLNMLEIKIDG